MTKDGLVDENLRTGEQKSATAAEKPEKEDSAKETAEKETDEETIVEEERCCDAGDGEEDAPRHHSTAKQSADYYKAHQEDGKPKDAPAESDAEPPTKKGRLSFEDEKGGIVRGMGMGVKKVAKKGVDTATGYAHQKVHQVEKDNSGVEAAHKSEEAAERLHHFVKGRKKPKDKSARAEKRGGEDQKSSCLKFSESEGGTAENAAEPDYTINNIDFGIVERARYKVQVDDKINKILLKSSDGNTIKEIVPSADMNVPNVKYLPSTGRTSKTQKAVKGSLEMELDSEILQRAELYVEYGFTVTNKSELDYNTKDYYRNGTKGTDSNIVRVTVSNMINYVDNELFYDDNSQMLTDSTKNSDYKWNKMNWKTDASKWIAEDAREKLTNSSTNDSTYTTVLLGQYFDRSALKPGQTSQPTKLLVNRTLTPTQDDMKYSDWTEIVEVTKTWGREIYKQDTNGTFGETLGNFNPNQPDPADVNNKNPGTNKEPDFHYPEDIIIHPPTGISKSLILYTVLGITVLVVLAVGIIIIKKKALK